MCIGCLVVINWDKVDNLLNTNYSEIDQVCGTTGMLRYESMRLGLQPFVQQDQLY